MSPLERLSIIRGDITRQKVDAIVNAANERLLVGGGVDGAIHRAAGPALLAECKKLGGCPTGQARITGGYNLPAKYVIHTVGPIWHSYDEGVAGELLASCYRNSLKLAVEHRLTSIAFPAISTGIYGFPPDRAALIAVGTLLGQIKTMSMADIKTMSTFDIRLVCFDEQSHHLHDNALAALTLH